MKASRRSPATPRRSWGLWLLVAGLCGLCALGAYALFIRFSTPGPPHPDLSRAEPLVVDAIAAARDAVVKNPRNASAWGDLGMVFHGHEFNAAARDAYAQAERLDPSDAAWPYLTGDTLWSDARRDEALAAFRRAVERSGTDQTAPLRLAEALLAQGMSDEAERVFETALTREPGNARALSGSARVRLARGDTDGALQRIQEAIRADSRRRSFFELLVGVYTARRDDTAAAGVKLPPRSEERAWPDRYLEAVESRRVTVPAISRRATRLVAQGRTSEAFALAKMAAARYPTNAEAVAGLGQIYFVLGQHQEAEAQLRKALSLDAASSDVRIALGTLLSAQSRCAEAVDEFRRVLAARPDSAEAHLELGDCLYQLGDKEGAVTATRLAVRYEPDNVQAHMNLGTVLFQLGRYDQALEELTAAAQLMPGDDQQRAQTIERLKSELNRRKQTRPERNGRP